MRWKVTHSGSKTVLSNSSSFLKARIQFNSESLVTWQATKRFWSKPIQIDCVLSYLNSCLGWKTRLKSNMPETVILRKISTIYTPYGKFIFFITKKQKQKKKRLIDQSVFNNLFPSNCEKSWLRNLSKNLYTCTRFSAIDIVQIFIFVFSLLSCLMFVDRTFLAYDCSFQAQYQKRKCFFPPFSPTCIFRGRRTCGHLF